MTIRWQKVNLYLAQHHHWNLSPGRWTPNSHKRSPVYTPNTDHVRINLALNARTQLLRSFLLLAGSACESLYSANVLELLPVQARSSKWPRDSSKSVTKQAWHTWLFLWHFDFGLACRKCVYWLSVLWRHSKFDNTAIWTLRSLCVIRKHTGPRKLSE